MYSFILSFIQQTCIVYKHSARRSPGRQARSERAAPTLLRLQGRWGLRPGPGGGGQWGGVTGQVSDQ